MKHEKDLREEYKRGDYIVWSDHYWEKTQKVAIIEKVYQKHLSVFWLNEVIFSGIAHTYRVVGRKSLYPEHNEDLSFCKSDKNEALMLAYVPTNYYDYFTRQGGLTGALSASRNDHLGAILSRIEKADTPEKRYRAVTAEVNPPNTGVYVIQSLHFDNLIGAVATPRVTPKKLEKLLADTHPSFMATFRGRLVNSRFGSGEPVYFVNEVPRRATSLLNSTSVNLFVVR